jgi:DNA-binding NarL/FixJ family response regulator
LPVRAGEIVVEIAQEFGLSGREEEVLAAAVHGQASKEIAFNLRISRRTVDYYWRQIFNKLSCRSQLEVIVLLFLRAAKGMAGISSTRGGDDPTGVNRR